MSTPTPRNFSFTSGFSLIEVVLALGVISFSLVAILAVFPAGFSANRSSIDDTRAAQLAQALVATIDAQCANFVAVDCYGTPLNLSTLTADAADTKTLYAAYPSPDQPQITTAPDANSIYTIELRFDNDPPLTGTNPPVQMGLGKLNQIEIRIYGKSRAEGFTEYFYLARNKG